MGKIYIPREDTQEDVFPTSLRHVPMRAVCEISKTEDAGFSIRDLLIYQIDGILIAEELVKRGVDIESLTRDALWDLLDMGLSSGTPKEQVELLTKYAARPNGPISLAVREVLYELLLKGARASIDKYINMFYIK